MYSLNVTELYLRMPSIYLYILLAPPETTMTPPPPGACDGKGPSIIADQHKGYIISSGHPKDYLNNQFCEWMIKADKDQVVQLTFQYFNLEDGYVLKLFDATIFILERFF